MSTITLNNTSANDAIVTNLLLKLDRLSLIFDGHLFHMCCSAYVLHMIVNDSLDKIGPSTKRDQNSVLYWTLTQQKMVRFWCCKKEYVGSDNKKIVLDVKTR